MSVQLQCVYGGSPTRHSVFRGQEKRERHRKIAWKLILTLLLITSVVFAYITFDTHLTAQGLTEAETTSCIAGAVVSLESFITLP